MKADIYRKVTETIVRQLEKGVRPWHKPWNAANTAGRITRPLRSNGLAYHGINVLVLWSDAVEKGFTSPYWITYKQAAAMGAQVRKGEHGSQVVYADRVMRTSTDDATGEKTERAFSFLKAYTVFNAAQVDGLPNHFYDSPAPRLDPIPRDERAETVFATLKADIRHGGNEAFYEPEEDFVRMPPFESFESAESYYAVLAHECAHWTGHHSRLDRLAQAQSGKAGRAMEELVAELSASFICADLDLAPEPRETHAAYIATWIKALKENDRAIFTASSLAQRAADYLNGLQVADAAIDQP